MRVPKIAAVVLLVPALGVGLGACSRGSVGGGGGSSVADFCSTIKTENARLANLTGSRAAVDRAADAVQKLTDAAPTEIRDDVDLLADAYQKAASGDFAALASKAVQFQAAVKHVTRYATAHCNFDLRAR